MAFLSGRGIRAYLLIVGVLGILAVLGTVVFFLLQDGRRGAETEAPGPMPEYDSLLDPSARVTVDLVVPEEMALLKNPSWRHYRERMDRWSQQQIAPFWSEPEDLIRETLVERTDEEVGNFFKDVP